MATSSESSYQGGAQRARQQFMRRIILAPLLTLVLMLIAASNAAAWPLTFLVAQKPTRLSWPQTAFPVSYEVDSNSPLIARNEQTIRAAFDTWRVPASNVSFKELPAKPLKAGQDGINAVTTRDDLFAKSGLVAFTSWWSDESTGTLIEADIQIDPAAVNDQNIARVVAHEAGHLLGLDHSGDMSSMMYPFVSGGEAAPLGQDDVHGVAALYPASTFGATFGSVEGSVTTSSGPVFGAHVVAVDANGSPAATALTDRDGQFEITGLPAGSYKLYTEPLDGPVDGRNLAGIYIDASKNFRSAFMTNTVNVTAASRVRGVTLDVDGNTPALNPKWVGAFAEGSKDISLSSMSARVKSGATIAIGVGGDGIGNGSTFTVDSPLVRRVSDFTYGSGYMYATFEIARVSNYTPLSIVVKNGGETAALTGALLVEPRSGRARPVR